MGTAAAKQYMELAGKPLIYYALKAFQDSQIMDTIVLVAGEGEVSYVQDEIVGKYDLSKVHAVVEGGAERYDSVWQGLRRSGRIRKQPMSSSMTEPVPSWMRRS